MILLGDRMFLLRSTSPDASTGVYLEAHVLRVDRAWLDAGAAETEEDAGVPPERIVIGEAGDPTGGARWDD